MLPNGAEPPASPVPLRSLPRVSEEGPLLEPPDTEQADAEQAAQFEERTPADAGPANPLRGPARPAQPLRPSR
jgi:hypothetical protein